MIKLLLAIVTSQALFTFAQFLISRYDKKQGILAEIKKDIKALKEFNKDESRDLKRLQLMTLIHIHPEDVSDIMEVAEEYFVNLDGNWYMSSIFRQYLDENKIEHPIWMKGVK